MHAKYVTTTGVTQAQIIADIAALLAGTAVASLSSGCDKVSTTLTSTVAPGWTIHDASPGSSGQVVKAADANTLTTKYVRLYASDASNIAISCAEGWNASTHVGTNNSITQTKTVPFATGVVNTFWVFATARGFYVATSGSTFCGIGALEITRDAAYLVGSTYPCVAAVSYDSLMTTVTLPSMPSTKKTAAAGDNTGSSANTTISACQLAGRAANSTPGTVNASVRDGAEVAYWEVAPIWLGVTGDTNTGVNRPLILGKFYDVLEIGGAAGNQFDTFSDGTDTYMIVFTNGSSGLAFKVA